MNGAMKADDREPDYKAAMMYHSDRADAFMAERDAVAKRLERALALGAENRTRAEAAEARIRSLEEALTKAVGRLKWCSGILPSDRARDDTWLIACEVEAALSTHEEGK